MTVLSRGWQGVGFLAFTLFGGNAQAISLNEFVGDVVQTHPTVLQSVHNYRQLLEDSAIASKGWRPTVDITGSVGSYKADGPATGFNEKNYSSQDAALVITQNLFNGFKTSYQQDQATARISEEIYRIFDQADNIALDAVNIYVDALKQRKVVQLAKINIDNHLAILSKITQRNDSGVGKLSELEQTKGRVAQSYASLYAAQNNLQDSLSKLHALLGRYISADELEEMELPAAPVGDLDRLIEQALAQHPALKSSAFNIEAARSNFKQSNSANYPQIDLRLKKSIGDDVAGLDGQSDEMSAVLHLNYNLYNGGADASEKHKRRSALYQNQEQTNQTRRQVIENYRLAWMAHTALSGQLGYLDEYQQRSEKTVGYYKEEFFVGRRDLLDLLDAESELNSAQIQYSEAYYSDVQARYRLLEGVGALFSALMIDVEIDDNALTLGTLKFDDGDTSPFMHDRDADNQQDKTDHCDNSPRDQQVNENGCHALAVEFGYK